MSEPLHQLEPGMPIPYGGNRLTHVGPGLAAAFRPGDRLIVVQDTGDLLHISGQVWESVYRAVDSAHAAFSEMGAQGPAAITTFYRTFARMLADPSAFAEVREANSSDVDSARRRGRSTTRLELSEGMRRDMIEGLSIWEQMTSAGGADEVVNHPSWRVEMRRAGLGVVGFVFEGRPNVFADATGVLRSGNVVVFRIGSDALGTARAIMTTMVGPALAEAGLPPGAVTLVDSPERSAGWALFSDPRLGLAVARGSGGAVSQLGAVARQAGTPVSLHGTGGAWMVIAPDAVPGDIEMAVYHSLDRKVCNTLNTAVVVGPEPEARLDAVRQGLRRAAERRGAEPKLHVVGEIEVPPWWKQSGPIRRASGTVEEPRAEPISADETGREWEWEDSPEITVMTTATMDEAIVAFNTYSPRFVASLISPDPAAHDAFYARIDAPFVGNGFTRWVDGQYALDRPELGLSNWQFGRLFGRGGVLSGDSIYTLRARAVQDHLDLGR